VTQTHVEQAVMDIVVAAVTLHQGAGERRVFHRRDPEFAALSRAVIAAAEAEITLTSSGAVLRLAPEPQPPKEEQR
jgi:hypothetical protein